MIVGRRSFPPGALLRSVLAICGSQLDFEFIDLIPLGVGNDTNNDGIRQAGENGIGGVAVTRTIA